MKKRISTFAIILFVVGAIKAQNCQCKYGTDTVFTLNLDSSLKLLVCGYLRQEISKNTKEITALTITDCSSNKELVNYGNDEIIPYKVIKKENEFIFQSMMYLPSGNNWDATLMPYMSRKIIVTDSSTTISAGETVFKYPELTKSQIIDINNMVLMVKSTMVLESKTFPTDEIGLKMIFVGALMNIGESKATFTKMVEYFEFDGAIYETLMETNYKTLLK